jgi:threonine dehydrogenase-like Zn-dependent dehydrogenase
VRQGLALLRPRGRLVVFSAVLGQTAIDLFPVHVKELQIVGACNDVDMLDAAIARLADKRLGLSTLVTHRFNLDDYQRAFELASKGREQAMKVAFEMEAAA